MDTVITMTNPSRRATRLAMLLNSGVDQVGAVRLAGLKPHLVMTENDGLPLGDEDNELIDLCSGVLVQRRGATEYLDADGRVRRTGGLWQVVGY
ncbi:hypothetical protein [Catellatospora sp. NPDC049133]|uniref:hypothetical protein n=1 Tax=Catellatospora sp. NPDC049133 TaxID=3155499 RepID=UPI0033C58083